jgi:coenzyme F420-reducing hydrogenase alpha subunit
VRRRRSGWGGRWTPTGCETCRTPLTSQNRASIEADLWAFVQERLDVPRDELVRQGEQAIRSYDPCISCAPHFLDLTMEES